MKPLAPKPTSPSDINEIEIEIADDNQDIKKKDSSENKNYDDVEVKLCDFSFSQILNPGKPILGMMGTVAYSGKILVFVVQIYLVK
jgi:hypothetical protein